MPGHHRGGAPPQVQPKNLRVLRGSAVRFKDLTRLQTRLHRRDDVALRREVAGLLGDDFVVHLDHERPGRSDLEIDLDAKLLLDRSRRTDGSGFVPSGVAVLDLDHASKIAVRMPARQRGIGRLFSASHGRRE